MYTRNSAEKRVKPVISSQAQSVRILVAVTVGAPDTSKTLSPEPTRTEPPILILGLYVTLPVSEATHIVRVFEDTLYKSIQLFPKRYT